jgi:hypothetical protein
MQPLLLLSRRKKKLDNFDDFRPISLCNYIYKIIAKVFVMILKDVLSNDISSKQFGFLGEDKSMRLLALHTRGFIL